MLTVPEATAAMKAHLDERVANLAAGIGGDDAELRAAIAVSSILGLTVARHFIELDALVAATDAELARVAGPAVIAGIGAATPPPLTGTETTPLVDGRVGRG
jgi:Tetracyclin repressor-like, C-terminal domain